MIVTEKMTLSFPSELKTELLIASIHSRKSSSQIACEALSIYLYLKETNPENLAALLNQINQPHDSSAVMGQRDADVTTFRTPLLMEAI